MKKYKIVAYLKQLENIGISYDITGLTGEYVKKFKDGWICLKVFGELPFENEFDMPLYYLQEIKE